MVNNFKTNLDGFGAEDANAGLTLFLSMNPQIGLQLPTDYDGGLFLTGLNKVQMILVELLFNDTEINTNQIALVSGKTTGTCTVRVYPNIKTKNWDLILWEDTKTTGTITCNILKDKGQTSVATNISNPTDLSTLSIGQEYIDFVFTLTEVSSNRPTLNIINLDFTGGI